MSISAYSARRTSSSNRPRHAVPRPLGRSVCFIVYVVTQIYFYCEDNFLAVRHTSAPAEVRNVNGYLCN